MESAGEEQLASVCNLVAVLENSRYKVAGKEGSPEAGSPPAPQPQEPLGLTVNTAFSGSCPR
jgi:hypothetical protein